MPFKKNSCKNGKCYTELQFIMVHFSTTYKKEIRVLQFFMRVYSGKWNIYIAQKQMPMDKRFVNKTYSIISYNISFDIGIWTSQSQCFANSGTNGIETSRD